jgi:hypothetical protein
MSAKKFKFVSPGIFINEIDNSHIPRIPDEMGPIVIGRSERGPGMRPVKVNSFSEFVEMFGEPIPGGRGDDVYRDGNYLAPTYAGYAAQAWLRNQSPLTFVRLLGVDHADATGTLAGWEAATVRPGAYGLFIADAPAAATAAQADIEINNAVAADVGFTVAMDSGATGTPADFTITEQSATKKAVIVDFNTMANLANLVTLGDNNETLTIVGPTGTKIYTLGDGAAVPSSGGDGSGLQMSNGAVPGVPIADTLAATRLAAFINDEDSNLFEAQVVAGSSGNSAVCINILNPGSTATLGSDLTLTVAFVPGAASALGAQTWSAGQNAAGPTTAASDGTGASPNEQLSVFCFDNSQTALPSRDDGVLSLRKACVDAGIKPSNLSTGLAAVDENLITQLKTEITANRLTTKDTGHDYTVAIPGDSNILVATKDAAGNTGNLGGFTSLTGSVVAGPGFGVDFSGGTNLSNDFGKAALSAIFYNATDTSHLLLEGQTLINSQPRSQCGVWFKSSGESYEFRMRVRNKLSGAASENTSREVVNFNFDPSSKKYIRKVFNTNPTLTNSAAVDDIAGGNMRSYWLGETFDKHLEETLAMNGPLVGTSDAGTTTATTQTQAATGILAARLRPTGAAKTAAGAQVACLVELGTFGGSVNPVNPGNYIEESRPSRSGWVFSQHQGIPEGFLLGDSTGEYPETYKLFRLHGLYSGEWDQSNLKISISEIKASTNPDTYPYGSFTLSVRKANDSDKAPQFIERYSGLTLDPNSSNYIGARVGDTETYWNETERRYTTVGQHDNNSQFVRVEVHPDLEAGLLDPTLLPFGFYGPPKYADVRAKQDEDLYTIGRLHSTTGWSLTGTDVTENLSIVQGATAAFGVGTALQGFASVGTATSSSDSEALPSLGGADGSEIADDGTGGANRLYFDGESGSSALLVMPSLKLRKNTRSGGMARARDCYWGINQTRKGSPTRADPGYGDYVRSLGASVAAEDRTTNGTPGQEHVHPAYAFSLDNIQYENAHATRGFGPDNADSASKNQGWDGVDDPPVGNVIARGWSSTDKVSGVHAEYLDENHDGLSKPGAGGSADDRLNRGGASARRMGSSLSSLVNSSGVATETYENTLKKGFDRFTMPLYGGQDGLDITEKEPFRNTVLENQSDTSHYAYNSIKRAIDACADPEVVECNLMTIPGVYEPTLTDHLIAQCEARADALAIIDLPGDYKPNTENTDSERDRLPDVDEAVKLIQDRVMNSSYGCAYFPWVQIRDQISNNILWVPPSVIALGTMANSQKRSQLWFAPAGFTRGGLSNGAAGLPVTNVRHRLNSEERDKLYEANINPIASFPAEGIVIFGQKTLQAEASALDRVNVRRLMIYLKKEISRMAATVLFDQNVKATWGRFTSKVNPFLMSVKSQFGLTEYKVILDESTTTPDLIDRNIMYAKIMLKPARSIEFIAIDFVITNSGASFAD